MHEDQSGVSRASSLLQILQSLKLAQFGTDLYVLKSSPSSPAAFFRFPDSSSEKDEKGTDLNDANLTRFVMVGACLSRDWQS